MPMYAAASKAAAAQAALQDQAFARAHAIVRSQGGARAGISMMVVTGKPSRMDAYVGEWMKAAETASATRT